MKVKKKSTRTDALCRDLIMGFLGFDRGILEEDLGIICEYSDSFGDELQSWEEFCF